MLSNCPVGWGMTTQESIEHLKGPVVEAYPLGVIVDRGVAAAAPGARSPAAPGARSPAAPGAPTEPEA